MEIRTSSKWAATGHHRVFFQIVSGKKVKILMPERTTHLLRVRAAEIPSICVSLERPWAVVTRWDKLHFFLGSLSELGALVRREKPRVKTGNISRLSPEQGQGRVWGYMPHSIHEHTVSSTVSSMKSQAEISAGGGGHQFPLRSNRKVSVLVSVWWSHVNREEY